jgi:hypothetical protein
VVGRLAFAAALAILCVAAPAAAQDPGFVPPPPNSFPPLRPPTPEWIPDAEGTRISNEVAVWPSTYSSTIVSTLVAQLRLTGHLYLDVEAPVAYIDVVPADDTGETQNLVFGNHTLGLHYALRLRPSAEVWFGGFVSAPVLNQPVTYESSDDVQPFTIYAQEARGFYNSYWFAAGALPIGLRGGVELRLSRSLYYRGEASFVFSIPLSGQDASFFIEQGNDVFARWRGASFGLRFQEVFQVVTNTVSFTPPIPVTLAVEPFVGYDLESRGLFARLGVLCAITDPLSCFTSGGVLTPRLTLGVRW